MPASYPRTESDIYEEGREKETAAVSEALDKIRKPSEDAREVDRQVKEINAKAGQKGNWSKELSKPEANSRYVVPSDRSDIRMEFTTDRLGRTENVVVKIERGPADWKQGTSYPGQRERFQPSDRHWRQSQIGKSGDPGDVGFHLIPRFMGGPGEAINIVPGSRELNANLYRQIEDVLFTPALKGMEARVEIQLRFESDGPRPSSFRIVYETEYFVGDFDVPNE